MGVSVGALTLVAGIALAVQSAGSGRTVGIVMAAIALPFLIAGIYAIYAGLRSKWLPGQRKWEDSQPPRITKWGWYQDEL